MTGYTSLHFGAFRPLAQAPGPATLARSVRAGSGHGGAGLQSITDHRSHSRSNVFLSAVLVAEAASLPVRVRNLSPRGAFLDGGPLPPVGAQVELVRGHLHAHAEVVWQAGGHAGLRFAGEIDVGEWVRRPGHAGQQRVDDAVAALRRNRPPPAGARAEPLSLRRLSAELDVICERLAASPAMTVELGEELLKLDALARALQQLASDS